MSAGRGHEFLTVDEVAELLCLSTATIRGWRRVGDGPPSFKMGRRVLYPADELKAWIETKKVPARTQADR